MSEDFHPTERSGGNKLNSSKHSRLSPVAISERIASVDVLRGFALLGILVINIIAFALPNAALFSPLVAGGHTGVSLLVWKISTVFFLQKFMAIFSMLFGAGLVLMTSRAEASGKRFGGIYYRRVLWLLLLALAHMYLLWWGDILYYYAICGLLLYPLRRRSGKLLIALGILLLLIGLSLQVGMGTVSGYARDMARQAEAALEAGETPTAMQQQMRQVWEGISYTFDPSPESVTREVETFRGNYWGMVKRRAPEAIMMQTQATLVMFLWRVGGLMLLGMGLMKLGIFSARRSLRFYVICIVIGYGIGLPVSGFSAGELIARNFDFVYNFKTGSLFDYFGSILVALGHIGVVMITCKSQLLAALKRRLAAVGRMALSNYLMHTVVFTTIFYGYGLSLYDRVDRLGLMGFVLGMWILQLYVSPLWLRHFRFGPAEWLWRSLTYWRRQPMWL